MAGATDAVPAHDRPEVEVGARKGLLTAAVMTAMVMQILDTTIANVALPHMEAALGATQESVTWVLTSYILASAVVMPATGWLSSTFGARNLLLFSVLTFTVASALCGLAPNLGMMVFFRTLQGIAGAFLGPLVQSVMLDINRPSQHPKAMSVYGMGVMIGPIAGPVLGGYLTENLDWRWVFFVNVPIGLLCLAALWFLLPRMPTQARRFDAFGWFLVAVALGGLQLLLDRGQTVDWFSSTESWIYLGVMIAAGWAFCIHNATADKPLFPLPMLADRNLTTGAGFMVIVGATTVSVMALLPPLMQNLYGYSVVQTGELLATRGIGVLITMFIAGRIASRVDPRLLVGSGFAITALSLWMMTGWTVEMDWRPFVLSGFVQGLGLGLVFVPLNVLSFATLPPAYRTDAAGLFNLARNVGSSIGISVMTVLLARNIQVSHADLASQVTANRLPADPGLLTTLGADGNTALATIDGLVNQQAAMIAYLNDFYVMMFVCLCMLPFLLLLKKPKPRTGADAALPIME